MRNTTQRVKRLEALEHATDEVAGKFVFVREGTISPDERRALESKGAVVIEMSPEDERL